MSTRLPQPAESSAKLMLEVLAKASAELEKSVTSFTEQLISFNAGLQKSLDDELRLVHSRLENCITNNIDDLGRNKHLMMKQLLEAEHAELLALSDAGKNVRSQLSNHALLAEEKIEQFMKEQISDLKQFLEQPETKINTGAQFAEDNLARALSNVEAQLNEKDQELRRQLSDKADEMERLITEECERIKQSISSAGKNWEEKLDARAEQICDDLNEHVSESADLLKAQCQEGMTSLDECEQHHHQTLNQSNTLWKEHITSHSDTFDRTISKLSSVVKENYETKLTNVSQQAREEITKLSSQAHEKIASTRNELEVELRELEKEYVHHFQQTLRKLEIIVAEQASDKRNSGVARQHKAQKLHDQMESHLNRWGSELVDSVRESAEQLENEYNRATDSFHVRIESTRSSAIELLDRDSRITQKEIERMLKEFQKEVSELKGEVARIEKAGQDAALTVIACRKAVLSFRGD